MLNPRISQRFLAFGRSLGRLAIGSALMFTMIFPTTWVGSWGPIRLPQAHAQTEPTAAHPTDPIFAAALDAAGSSMTFASYNAESIKTYANAVQNFIRKPGNRAWLQTHDGQRLLHRQSRVMNWLAIQRVFDECLTSPESQRSLKARILDAAGRVQEFEIHCRPDLTSYADLESFAYEIRGMADRVRVEDLAGRLKEQAVENAFLTFLDVKLRYGPARDAPALLRDFCKSPKESVCSEVLKPKLLARANSYTASFKKTGGRRRAPHKIAEELNAIVATAPDGVELPVEPEQLGNENLLFLTDTLRMRLRQRKPIVAGDITVAAREIELGIARQMQAMSLLDRKPNPSRGQRNGQKNGQRDGQKNDQRNGASRGGRPDSDDLESKVRALLKSNPAAVGQVLMNSPESADLVCRFIQEIEAEDDSDHARDELFLWGGVVVGGALIATGAFAWAGAGLLAASGAAAITVSAVNTVAAASFVGSAGVGLVQTGYQMTEAARASQEARAFERATLSGSGDARTIEERQEALARFNEAKIQAALSLGLTALDLGALTAMVRTGRMVEVTEMLTRLSGDAKAVAAFKRAGSILSADERAVFLEHLASLPSQAQSRLLASMRNWSPQKFKEFIGGLGGRLAESTRNYLREMRANPLKRLVFKPRDQAQSRNVLHNPVGWLSNPIAMARNSSREMTIPAQTALFVGVESGARSLREKGQSRMQSIAEARRDRIPGGEYVFELSQGGAIESVEATRLILDHDRAMESWLRSGSKTRLPRESEFRKLGLVSESESARLDHLARQAFAQTEADQKRGPHPEGLSFVEQLTLNLRGRLDQDTSFSGKRPEDLELLSTYYWPEVKIKGRSDTELARAMIDSSAVGDEAELHHRALRNVYTYVNREGLDLGAAYQMASTALDAPEVIAQKLERGRALLPEGRLDIAIRPDLPDVAHAIEFNADSRGDTRRLETELDRWEIFIRDPRFDRAEEAWKAGQMTDRQALAYVEQSVSALNEIYETQGRGQPLTVDRAQALLGLKDGEPGNPYISDVGPTIQAEVQKRGLSSANAGACYRDITSLFVEHHTQQAEWIRSGAKDADFHKRRNRQTEETTKRYDQLLKTCGS